MKNNIENQININEKWYFMIVQNPSTAKEEFMAFQEENTKLKFLPIFKTKEEAKQCFKLMPKELFSDEYEVQAVIEDDLLSIANEYDYQLYLLDGNGKIYNKLMSEQK